MKKSLFHYCVIDKKDFVLAEVLLRFGADPSQDRYLKEPRILRTFYRLLIDFLSR